MRIHRSILAVLSASLLILGGCESADRDEEPIRVDAAHHANAVQQAKQDWTWISGTTWVASSIEGRVPLEHTSLWIRFEDHTWLTGSAGCNHLSASYSRKGIDGLKLTSIAATKMHCAQPEGTMQQESRFLYLLGVIDAYDAESDTLMLSSQGVTLLTFTRYQPESNQPTEE